MEIDKDIVNLKFKIGAFFTEKVKSSKSSMNRYQMVM